VTAPDPTASAVAIDTAEVELSVADALLRSVDATSLDAARHLLASVESELGRVASAADTDTDTARRLLSVRADISGHLLAAGALETAGAPADGVARMLRRAAGVARVAVAAEVQRRRAPVGVGP